MSRFIITTAFALFVLACGGNNANNGNASVDGEAIYKKNCVVCHGIDGKLGLNGSKDLTVSQVTEAERIVQITKGKNTMTPFEGILSAEEIKAVAAYTMTLTNK
jgi:mono/diheme cytochrome c family protein